MCKLRVAVESVAERPISPKIAAIIPVLNESGAIGPTVRGLPPGLVTLVVDGGSTDGTVDEARAAGAIVLQEHRPGYGQACATGVEKAAELGAEVALFLDGDGADDPAAVPAILGPVLDGTRDFVIATRARRAPGSMAWHQVAAGRIIGAAVGVTCGVRYADMCAFRAIRIDTLRQLHMREMGYGWNLEMQMRAARARLRIAQVPVSYRCRIAGESKVAGSLRGTWRAGTRIMRVLVRIAAER